jgi:hypothetical protein
MGRFALSLGYVYINVAMEICMQHPIMAEGEESPTLQASLHNPVRVSLPPKEEQRRLFFITGVGGEKLKAGWGKGAGSD